MKTNPKTLLVSLLIPLLVGFSASILTREGVDAAALLQKPPLAPPSWLFPVVWTILYALMGYASYLVYTADAEPQQISAALTIYFAQLLLNFAWTLIFFNLEWYFGAVIVILVLWSYILRMILHFAPISQTAAWLMVPYLLWVTFAAYLTVGIWLLN